MLNQSLVAGVPWVWQAQNNRVRKCRVERQGVKTVCVYAWGGEKERESSQALDNVTEALKSRWWEDCPIVGFLLYLSIACGGEACCQATQNFKQCVADLAPTSREMVWRRGLCCERVTDIPVSSATGKQVKQNHYGYPEHRSLQSNLWRLALAYSGLTAGSLGIGKFWVAELGNDTLSSNSW